MSDGPGAGVEVAASTAREETGEQEQAAAAEPGASKTKFSSAGPKPPVAPTAGKQGPSASDQAFGDASELPTAATLDPVKKFRAAIAKQDPSAIAIAGASPAMIGAQLAKDPVLAGQYFELVAAHRSGVHREPLGALFPHLTLANKKKLFAAQYGFEIVEKKKVDDGSRNSKVGVFQADQIDKMYAAAAMLPPDHMIGNPQFKKLEAGAGATFYDDRDTIEMPSHPEASTGSMEAPYSSAFRHEVGHAVDFALGEKTDNLRQEFGWRVIKERDDDDNLAAHLEELGVLALGLEAQERRDLASAMGNAISGGDSYMPTHLTFFRGYTQDRAADLIKRGVTSVWKERRAAFYEDGMTIGDDHYFSRGFGIGGWAYKVKKSTFDTAPPKGKVSHYEWFAEWYATYYATPDHAGVSGRLKEFFRDEVEPFNQQRSALGSPDTKDGTGGTTPRHM